METVLETGIRKWISEWNKDLRPFDWVEIASEILETLAAYCGLINEPGHWANARTRAGVAVRSPCQSLAILPATTHCHSTLDIGCRQAECTRS